MNEPVAVQTSTIVSSWLKGRASERAAVRLRSTIYLRRRDRAGPREPFRASVADDWQMRNDVTIFVTA